MSSKISELESLNDLKVDLKPEKVRVIEKLSQSFDLSPESFISLIISKELKFIEMQLENESYELLEDYFKESKLRDNLLKLLKN
jgi:hypothetical protein